MTCASIHPRLPASCLLRSFLSPHASRLMYSTHFLGDRSTTLGRVEPWFELKRRQADHAEPRDIEENVFADEHAQIPPRMMVPLEFFEHPFGVLDAQSFLHRIVVIQREVPLGIL